MVGAGGGALHHGEEQLHVDLRRSAALDEAAAQPVAGRAVGLRDLIDPHAVALLIQTADLLPLQKKKKTPVEMTPQRPFGFSWTFAGLFEKNSSHKQPHFS